MNKKCFHDVVFGIYLINVLGIGANTVTNSWAQCKQFWTIPISHNSQTLDLKTTKTYQTKKLSSDIQTRKIGAWGRVSKRHLTRSKGLVAIGSWINNK